MSLKNDHEKSVIKEGIDAADRLFDAVFCINLKHRMDRLVQFRENLPFLPLHKLHYMHAAYGKHMDTTNWEFPVGQLGCRQSHLNVLNFAIEKKYERIFILEDDALILPQYSTFITHFNKTCRINRWDILYLGCKHLMKPQKFMPGICRIRKSLTTHALALNGTDNIKLIRDYVVERRIPIDCAYADLHDKLVVLCPLKDKIIQRKSFSDILEIETGEWELSFTERLKHSIQDVKQTARHLFRINN